MRRSEVVFWSVADPFIAVGAGTVILALAARGAASAAWRTIRNRRTVQVRA